MVHSVTQVSTSFAFSYLKIYQTTLKTSLESLVGHTRRSSSIGILEKFAPGSGEVGWTRELVFGIFIGTRDELTFESDVDPILALRKGQYHESLVFDALNLTSGHSGFQFSNPIT
jgi:hypothetical protein